MLLENLPDQTLKVERCQLSHCNSLHKGSVGRRGLAISEVVLCSVFSHSRYHNNWIFLGTCTDRWGTCFKVETVREQNGAEISSSSNILCLAASFSHLPAKWDPPALTCTSPWTLLQHWGRETAPIARTGFKTLLQPSSCNTAWTSLGAVGQQP